MRTKVQLRHTVWRHCEVHLGTRRPGRPRSCRTTGRRRCQPRTCTPRSWRPCQAGSGEESGRAVGDYRTASAHDTQTQAAITGALLACYYTITGGRFVGQQARSHGGSLCAAERRGRRGGGRHRRADPGPTEVQQETSFGSTALSSGVQLVLVAQPPADPHAALSRSFCKLTRCWI